MNSSFLNKRRPPPSTDAGFTLIEVLISMFLLMLMTFSIGPAVHKTYALRDVLLNEGDFNNSVRMSMSIMDRDISMLFSPHLMMPDKKKTAVAQDPNDPSTASSLNPPPPDAEDLATIMGDAGRTTKFWGGAVDKSGLRPMHFIGTDSKLSFVALSHIRVYRESPESEFIKVSYELGDDKVTSRQEVPETTRTLIREISPNAFEEDDRKDGQTRKYSLLRGITKIKFRYWQQDKERWNTSWDSDSSDFKNIYPDMIEVQLEVKGASRSFFEGVYHFRPEVPLNGIDPST